MVTVAEVLSETPLGLLPRHLADPALRVRWVATSELPDPGPFLEGGELLLTTGLNAQGWRSEWAGYVDRLRAAGVAGIGLATGLSHRQVPRSLVKACNERDVNLFEVPRQTTFVSVSRAVADLLEQERHVADRTVLAWQRELTQAALERDARGVVERVARLLGGSAALLSPSGQVELGPEGAPWDVAPAVEQVGRIRPAGLRASSTVGTPGSTTMVQPVGLTGTPDSYLAVCTPGTLDEAARATVTTAVALLGLAGARGRERRDTARRLSERAYELLLHGDPHGAAIVVAATRGVHEVTLPTLLEVVRVVGTAQQLDDVEEALARSVEAVAARRTGEELQVCLAPSRGLGRLFAGRGVRAGLGGAVEPTELERSHVEAGYALERAAGPGLHAWAEVRERGVLSLLEADRLAAFARELLTPLGEAGVLPTLEVFLRRHGSVVATAEELGVHRNTVRNRLATAERLLGRSLEDVATRMDVWAALQAHAGPLIARGQAG